MSSLAKSKYFTHVEPKLKLVECWARDGLTDEQISKNLGISKTTLYKYKDEHIELFELLKKGKEIVDYEVENALLKRALGYEYDEITYECGEEVKRVRKQVAPDTTAQIFWLKNRKPEQWREKQVIESSNTVEFKSPLEGLSTGDLKKLIKDG